MCSAEGRSSGREDKEEDDEENELAAAAVSDWQMAWLAAAAAAVAAVGHSISGLQLHSLSSFSSSSPGQFASTHNFFLLHKM